MKEVIAEQLVEQLDTRIEGYDHYLYTQLKELGADAVKPLLRKLASSHKKWMWPCNVTTALRNVGGPALGPLSVLLEHSLDGNSFEGYLKRELSFSSNDAQDIASSADRGLLLHYVIDTMGKIGEKEKDSSPGPALLTVISSPLTYTEENKPHTISEDAAKALSRIRYSPAVESISSAVTNPNISERESYAYINALGDFQDTRAVPNLIPLLESAEEIRKHAKTALAKIGGDQTAAACYDFLAGKLSKKRESKQTPNLLDSAAEHAVFQIFEKLGPISTPYLDKLFKDDIASPTKERIKLAKAEIKINQDTHGSLHHYLLDHEGLREEIKTTFGYTPYAVEKTDYGLLIREDPEIEHGTTHRFLILKPGRSTGMKSHPGTVYADITYLGTLGVSTKKFEKGHSIFFQFYERYDALEREPHGETFKSGQRFPVVKGEWGHWHSLFLTYDAVSQGPAVLKLYKEMSFAAK